MVRHILYLALGLALGTCGAMGYISPQLNGKLVGMTENMTAEELGGAVHECYRECVEGDTRVCDYQFTLVEYSTMAIACGDCPYTETDCYSPGCITAGGEIREIKVVNHMLPGPSIQVCKGDTVRIEMENNYGSEGSTIHWHGMYQIGTPFMDGVPYVTQCPVHPGNTFVYNFTANPAGTHMWHSHVGLQETDGFFGSVVVRTANDTLAKYYDFDLPEHIMIVWHWYGNPTSSVLKSTFYRGDTAPGHSITINGMAATTKFPKDGVDYFTPRADFTVEQGYRYRFRIIGNMALYCPIQVSVDNHTMLVIASDGSSVSPVEVEALVVNAGERWDCVVTANQPIGDYWIRYRGLGNCAIESTYGMAILHYINGNYAEPLGSVTYADTDRSGVLLNPVGLTSSYPNNTLIEIADLENTSDDVVDVSGVPDYIFYRTLAMKLYEEFHTPGPYAQMDDMSFDFPPVPMLTQYPDISEDDICRQGNYSNADCYGRYCSCPSLFFVELGSLVEIFFIDNSTIANDDHPIHMHGGHFSVVAMERGYGTQTLDDLKARNENGTIKKNLYSAPQKDSFGVPSHGFGVVRFWANNPGYWFFHCHVAAHMEEGMAFVMKVGNDSEMAHPRADFPTCQNYDATNASYQGPKAHVRPSSPNVASSD